jgi:hypothetical protein
MTLSADDRAAFVDLLGHLGEDADPRAAHAFADHHRDALFDELGALPGAEPVRVGALRLLPRLAPDPDRFEAGCEAAGSALLVVPGDHPTERLARPPAWIGLGVLELADLRASWEGDPLDRALEVAGRAFVALGVDGVGEGEVAWALAEVAEEVDWHGRARALWEAVLERPFQDPVRRGEGRLIAAIRRDMRGAPSEGALAAVVDDEEAASESRTHAAWILAHVRRRSGDAQAARAALERAAALVDAKADPGIAAQIRSALEAW